MVGDFNAAMVRAPLAGHRFPIAVDPGAGRAPILLDLPRLKINRGS
jgi:hypothetical protein